MRKERTGKEGKVPTEIPLGPGKAKAKETPMGTERATEKGSGKRAETASDYRKTKHRPRKARKQVGSSGFCEHLQGERARS